MIRHRIRREEDADNLPDGTAPAVTGAILRRTVWQAACNLLLCSINVIYIGWEKLFPYIKNKSNELAGGAGFNRIFSIISNGDILCCF
ncbi:MAG TPA: hypothetical protein VHZ76_03805 [Gammaproteobacteria bacterium]|nr:hypothetical protein [Gammaproteobacteria bacterium]